MRLLELKANGEPILREFAPTDLPAYAILSHTWGVDSEEVSFQDIQAGKGKRKAGYHKIKFCAEQATANGLRYFWVDTCCIDKKNAVELSEAINSMFYWYKNAARCYVYLPDVSLTSHVEDPHRSRSPWEPDFRASRWFTRGWTLQELIAPTLVEFFTLDGKRLGSKSSLGTLIHEITGIAEKALTGGILSDFSVDERMAWAAQRNTKLEEDGIYSLLGIFDISMPLIYGEGREKASRRLYEEIEKSSKAPGFEEFAVDLNLSTTPESVQFVAREKELVEMHRLLYRHAARSIVVLHGLGGIGKTQLALAYARLHKARYTAIFWINANDHDSLKLSFTNVAQQILRKHPSASMLASLDLEGNLDLIVTAVKEWLSISKNKRWLIIYDNYDNPKVPSNPDLAAVDIRRFLPESDHGSILITTRSSQVTIGPRIHIQKLLNVEDGLEILSNTSGRKDITEGMIPIISKYSKEDAENVDTTATELVQELDGLPLALSTAGAYLEQVSTSFSEYLRLYRVSWLKLQTTSPRLNSYEDRSLYTTWQLSLDQIERQNKLSAKLLKLWAYFDRHDVWFELLRHGGSADSDWISQLTEDELSFNEAIRILCNYGLVDLSLSSHEQVGSKGYSMHSCVHLWTICVLNKEWDEDLARLALYCTASEVPQQNANKWWLIQRRLLQHTARCAYFILNDKVGTAGLEWSMHSLGLFYYNQGNLAEAEEMYKRALQGNEVALGPKHTSTLDTIHNLGLLYSDQGKLAEAEEMYKRALQGKEAALGPKHTSTLLTVSNLGVFYSDQGKLAEAEEMHKRALQGKEAALGPKHTSTLDTVHNLGNLYYNQGKLAEAEEMYKQALQGYEVALGPKHTSTLLTVGNLGVLYYNQGKLAEAEEMYKRALQGYEVALGPKHTSTLLTVGNLGVLYYKQGNLAAAEEIYKRALQGYEVALGPKHTSTLNTVNNLGLLYYNQGKLAEAEEMYKRALQGYEEALGPSLASSYIPALNTMFNLGNMFSEKKEKEIARTMYSRALSGFATVQGPLSSRCRELERKLAALDYSASYVDSHETVPIRPTKGKSVSTIPRPFGKLRK